MAVLEAKRGDIGRGAFGQLGDERLGAGEVVDDVETGIGGFESGFDLGEGVGERGGGEDRERCRRFRGRESPRRRPATLRALAAGLAAGAGSGGIAGPGIDLGRRGRRASAERAQTSISPISNDSPKRRKRMRHSSRISNI